MEQGGFLTVREAAECLAVHPITVYTWIKTGKLPAVALSRKSGYRVRAADFERFLRARSGKSVRAVEREFA
jgi:excisionase family DNA binding protein